MDLSGYLIDDPANEKDKAEVEEDAPPGAKAAIIEENNVRLLSLGHRDGRLTWGIRRLWGRGIEMVHGGSFARNYDVERIQKEA